MVIFSFLSAIEMCQGISNANKMLLLKAKFLHCQATLISDNKSEFLFCKLLE